MHQLCNSGRTAKAEISSLENEIEMLRKDLTEKLDKNGSKGKRAIDLQVFSVLINIIIHSIACKN